MFGWGRSEAIKVSAHSMKDTNVNQNSTDRCRGDSGGKLVYKNEGIHHHIIEMNKDIEDIFFNISRTECEDIKYKPHSNSKYIYFSSFSNGCNWGF